MKNRVVKYLLVALCICSLLMVAACGKDKESGDGNGAEQIPSSLTLAQTEMNLKVGDTGYILPTVERISGVEFEYESLDATIASVTSDGEVTALKEGNTEIVVKYGDLQAKCKVYVSLGGELPLIVVNGVDEASVQNVARGTTFTINPYVTFNGKQYNDATFEYAIEDEAIAVEENGGIKALSCGETVVKITADWRGVQNSTLERTFTLKVIPNVELSVNGGLNSVIDLYSVAQLGNKTFPTSSPFNITATEITDDGEVALTTAVQIISPANGADFITISNNKIESNGKVGQVTLRISCQPSVGEECVEFITVNILHSVGEYDQAIEFSAADGILPIVQIFGSDQDLVSAECEGEVLTISQDKKCILGLTTSSTGVTEKAITVYGENVGYKINVNAYTKIINTPKDLEYFLFNNSPTENITTRFNGYYILGKDIDASDYDYTHGTNGFIDSGARNSDYANVGLTGTFDGRGHKISNLTLGYVESDFSKFTEGDRKKYAYSLFGIIGGGTVKNLAIENITLDVPSEVTIGGISVIATQMIGGTIENVYISLNGLNYSSGNWRPSAGIVHRVDAPVNCKPSKIKNCIIEIADDGSVQAALSSKGSLSGGYGLIFGSVNFDTDIYDEEKLNRICENVYVISDLDLAMIGSQTIQTIGGVKRYDTLGEFMDDTTNVYSGFDGTYWTLTSDCVPVWKGMESSRYARIALGGKSGSSFEVNMADVSGPYELSVKIVGTTVDDVSFTVDGDCVSIDGTTLTVNHFGAAKITASFDYRGAPCTIEANIAIICDTEVHDQVVEFSAMHGTLTEVIGDAEIVYATQDGKALTISQDKKSIVGIKALDEKGEIVSDRAVETTITVYTKKGDDYKGYVITLNVYAGILTEAKDLNVFNLDNTDYKPQVGDMSHPQKKIEGYYVLGSDINASGYAMPTQGYISTTYNSAMNNAGFFGTFDGRGYVIKGITFGGGESFDVSTRDSWNNNHYSLFGIIGSGATVKNFAMTDVKFSLVNNYTGGAGPLYKATCATLAMWICNGATVENVYISVKGIVAAAGFNGATGDLGYVNTFTSFGGLAYGIGSGKTDSDPTKRDTTTGAKLNNVVVDFTYSESDVLAIDLTGALVYRKWALSGIPTTWENVYVISEKTITGMTGDNEMHASNDSSAAATGKQITGVYQHASVDDWKGTQGNNFDSFTSDENSEYWDVPSGGVPTWKRPLDIE